ncbi:MAG: TlpA family protein disulfide reductase [Prevotellaceae bacterium]|jgi:peroxiredoxin|nr:TlpA family protein disulfide reductase [Prevotellaceae bacterium]
MKKIPVLLFLLACVAFSCKNRTAPAEDASRGYIVKTGDEAPDFQIQYLDGSTERLSNYRGKVVMLQFTASWCGVCRKEMPSIERDIWQKHKENLDFALIAVDYKEPADTVQEFAESIRVTYPLTLDESGGKFHLYAAQGAGVTRNIIINRDGKIAFLTRLYDPAEFAEMVRVIDELLAQPSDDENSR